MAIGPDDDPFPTPRCDFEAAWARHEALIAKAHRAHEARVAEARRRMEAAVRGHRARIDEAQRRMVEAIRLHRMRIEDMERRRNGGPFPPRLSGSRRRRDGEDGETIPAVPAPKPKPLRGGAEAPVE